jgi:tetratricopeptide (TPR) repeat protein
MLNKIIRFHLPLLALLIPLFFLPITPDFFKFNKTYLIYTLATSALLFSSLKIINEKKINLNLSPTIISLLVLIILLVLSSIIQSPIKYISLTGQTALFTSFLILFLSITSTISSKEESKNIIKQTIYYLSATFFIVSVVKLLSYSGILESTGITWLNSNLFDTTGGPIAFLGFSLPILPLLIYLGLKSKSKLLKILLLLSSATGLTAIIVTLIPIVTQLKTSPLPILPFSAGWSIAVDTFKNIRTGLLGTGPNTYLYAFTRLRPASLNLTELWNVRFSNSSSFILTLLTTVGLPATITFIFALTKPLQEIKKTKTKNLSEKAIFLGLLLHLIFLFFIPENIIIITNAFIFLILAVILLPSKNKVINMETKPVILPILLVIPTLILASFFWILASRSYAANFYTYKALELINTNAIESYNYQAKAYNLDPNNTTYRINFSQTSLALASTLAAKENPTDQDKKDINQLIQQAIREANNATQINPSDIIAWENLAQIYRQLINYADGARDWSIASYLQAERIDPTNPQLKLDIGGLFLSLNDPQEAIKMFSRAVEIKPNWANGYYNLAAAYKANKSDAKALEQMRIVVQLVDPTSDDYQKASNELKALEETVGKQQNQPTTEDAQPTNNQTQNIELITPSPIPSPAPENKIVLPEDSAPIIPSPTPEETTPTTSPSTTPEAIITP